MSLSVELSAVLRDLILGAFDMTGPFLGRDLRTQTAKLRLAGTGGVGIEGVVGLPPGPPPGGVAPTASYQWLLFETIDGSVPAGAAEFVFEGPTIPFVGAVTEVDVIASEPVDQWQMKVEISGQGPIFRTTQSAETFIDEGWFRPTPPGFWPETESLVFPLPSGGSRPVVKVRRVSSAVANLTLRVLLVAQPSF